VFGGILNCAGGSVRCDGVTPRGRGWHCFAGGDPLVDVTFEDLAELAANGEGGDGVVEGATLQGGGCAETQKPRAEDAERPRQEGYAEAERSRPDECE
jgi:hypothetical protein